MCEYKSRKLASRMAYLGKLELNYFQIVVLNLPVITILVLIPVCNFLFGVFLP